MVRTVKAPPAATRADRIAAIAGLRAAAEKRRETERDIERLRADLTAVEVAAIGQARETSLTWEEIREGLGTPMNARNLGTKYSEAVRQWRDGRRRS